ncbi:cytochrome c biogenesis protein CcmA [Stappia sp. 22II-S9-Z10]|nr:cytochrome c biogenesis protein CcmA [Stappia sp. 22II-S9-Z10]
MLTLEIEDLEVERGGRRVLSGVALTVAGGNAVAVVGANGAGKSTFLRTIAGLIRPVSGMIRLVPAEGPASIFIHMVAHQNGIKLPLSAEENVRFWAHTLGTAAPDPAAIEDALDRVGLLKLIETPAQFFSQGQRRRLALARLLAVPRPVWLLDEPTAGLDTASRRAFGAIMAEHLAAGGIILAATHEPLGVAAATLDLTAKGSAVAAGHTVPEGAP